MSTSRDIYMTNLEISGLLRKISAAYLILNENRFKIIAYDKAADSIEALTGQVEELWKLGKLDEIDGVGKTISQRLDELFKTGKVAHFDEILAKLPESVFPLLLVPGIGPKKAYRLVTELKLLKADRVVDDLADAAAAHKIAVLEGFGDKSEADILANIDTFKKGQIKENRILISEADRIASEVMDFLKDIPGITKFDTLGSLRRRVATIGDIDIAVATKAPETVIEKFITYPNQKIIERGPTGASLLLNNGRQVDLRVQDPKSYGAMLQYFTGSKNHNITLRSLALERGLSLNEYGIKNLKTKKLQEYDSEEAFYHALDLPWIPPEMREDRGEIKAAAHADGLPDLIQTRHMKGDLHIHTAYDLSTSHDLGANTLDEYLTAAAQSGYEYIGISDHNPSVGNHTKAEITKIMEKRYAWYTTAHKKWKHENAQRFDTLPELFIMCEVDILTDGELALPAESFEFVDAVIVSLHSSFSQPVDQLLTRVTRALTASPKVRIFGHPTGRLIGKRDGVVMPWDAVYDIVKERDIALEINASPQRLDISDSVVFEARKLGIRFCIDTDSHAVDQMSLMKYGVSVARRGWAAKRDVVNTMGYTMFRKWLIR